MATISAFLTKDSRCYLSNANKILLPSPASVTEIHIRCSSYSASSLKFPRIFSELDLKGRRLRVPSTEKSRKLDPWTSCFGLGFDSEAEARVILTYKDSECAACQWEVT